ncbi:MAG: hypothetical protein ACE5H4_00585 [Candidatus Thorarchaeota archaeon]
MEPEDIYTRLGHTRDRLADVTAPSDVFTRQFGSELAGWELNLLKAFKRRVSVGLHVYRGFVHHTRDKSLILLTPSPWLVEGVFVQFHQDQETPPDGSQIEVVGRPAAVSRTLERTGKLTKALYADSYEIITMDVLSVIEPPMSLKEMSSLLFENVGMAEASKRVFALLFVSSPPIHQAVGGLTTGIQAIASQTQVQRLLVFMRRVLSPTLRGRWPKRRRVNSVRVSTPRLWRLDVGQQKRKKMEDLCVQRQDNLGFREVSVGALTNLETAALPDVPLALASEDFWIETRNPAQLKLPILKSAITFQMLSPEITQRAIDAGTRHILGKLEGLRESFGLDYSALARGHLLDADALGRPLSAIRLARSTARASWKKKTNAKDIKHSWNRVLEPALNEFMELTQLRSETERDWGKDSRAYKFNTKVLRALKKLDTGKTGSLGPTLEDIAAEAAVKRHVAAETLGRMKQSGVLYEPRLGHYRLV